MRRLSLAELAELAELANDLNDDVHPIPMDLMSGDEQRAFARSLMMGGDD